MHVIRLFGNARRADCADIALQEASMDNLVFEKESYDLDLEVKQDAIKPSCFIFNIIIAAYASDPHVSQVLSLAWILGHDACRHGTEMACQTHLLSYRL